MGDLDYYVHGSTKKILSLAKHLPDRQKIEETIGKIASKIKEGKRKRNNFKRHPRRLVEDSSEESSDKAESLVVLKKPACDDAALTDSSDEYCDVTVRKDEIEIMGDECQLENFILDSCLHHDEVSNKSKERKDAKLCNKVEKERRNSVKKLDSKKDVQEDSEKPPKIYLDRKTSGVIGQSLQILDDIANILAKGMDVADGSDDYLRQRKRALEFSCRFSRIYLYQLNRHISDMQDIVTPSSGRQSYRSCAISLNQKFISACQNINQGLQAYCKHLQVAAVDIVSEKFKEMLRSICSLCTLYNEHCDRKDDEEQKENIIETLEYKTKWFLDHIDAHPSSSKTVLKSSSNVSLRKTKTSSQINKKLKQEKSRLSMYHTVPIRGDIYWKKAVASLAQKKFNVPSRYKTAQFKHRPPAILSIPSQQPSQEKVGLPRRFVHRGWDRRYSPTKSRRARKGSLNDMDNITTLIQAHDEGGAGRGPMWNIAQGFFEKIFKDNQTMSNGEYECILEHFITMMHGEKENAVKSGRLEHEAQDLLEQKLGTSMEKVDFKEFVDKLVQYINEQEGGKAVYGKSSAEVLEKEIDDDVVATKKDNYKPPTITVSGAKNAQLICIKDDNSIIDIPSEEAKPTEKQKSQHKAINRKSSNKIYKDANVQIQNEPRYKIEDDSILIYKELENGEHHKAPKNTQNLKSLKMLPQDSVVKVIEYKLKFHKEAKNNYMYKKLGDKSPLILLEHVTDYLLEEVLQSITRDIQVDEILKKIYAHEFK